MTGGGSCTRVALPQNSFIDPTASIDARQLSLGDCVYIAPFAVIKSPGAVRIGRETNLQDGAFVGGLSRIGDRVSLAHRSQIIDSTIGNNVFIGFGATVSGSRIGRGAFIAHGARINGADLEEGAYVPPGGSSPSGRVSEDLKSFMDEVLEVNLELARGYREMQDSRGVLSMIGPSPKTSWGREVAYPMVDPHNTLREVRVIGRVELRGRIEAGSATSIRGDEGFPLIFGRNVSIGKGVVFHSLKHSSVKIGDGVRIGDFSVVHGPIEIGEGAIIGRGCILLRAEIEGGRVVGDDSIIIGG